MRHLAIALALTSVLGQAHADTWSWPSEVRRESQKFGTIEVAKTYDGKSKPGDPVWGVEVRRNGKLLAKFGGVTYERLFASPDSKLFVGLSNSGLPGTAVVVFGSKGNLLLEAKHGIVQFDYCDHSVTVVRKWYDDQKPMVQFVASENGDGFKAIRVRTCRGDMVDLLDTVLQGYARTVELKKEYEGRRDAEN